jgi:hypothetical protein
MATDTRRHYQPPETLGGPQMRAPETSAKIHKSWLSAEVKWHAETNRRPPRCRYCWSPHNRPAGRGESLVSLERLLQRARESCGLIDGCGARAYAG